MAVSTLKVRRCPLGKPLLEKVPLDVHWGDVQVNLAYCELFVEGRESVGVARIEKVLLVSEQAQDRESIAKANTRLSQHYLREAKFDLSISTAHKALDAIQAGAEDFHPDTITNVYVQLIELYCRLKRYDAVAGILAQIDTYREHLSRRGKGWLLHREAMYREEIGDYGLAKGLLEEMHDLGVNDDRLNSQYEKYIPWIYYHQERYEEATARIAKIKNHTFDSFLLAAYIAAAKGEWVKCDEYLKQAAAIGPPDEDYRWEHKRAVAELAEQLGDSASAEKYYREAIVFISSLRLAAPNAVPFFVASHRGPFEGLISLLAEQGRWRDALTVVLLLDESNLLEVTSVAKGPATISPSSVYELPDSAKIDPFRAADAALDEVIARWSANGGLIVLVAPEPRMIGPVKTRGRKAYRISVKDNQVVGEVIGDAEEIESDREKLWGNPADEDAGKVLAKAFVPDLGGAEPVVLLGVGRLGKLPLAGLRAANGKLLMSQRSLSRTLSLRSEVEAPPHSSLSVVVASDPIGKRHPDAPPSHFQEDAETAFNVLVKGSSSREVRRYGLGTSAPATRARLWEAKNAEVFYLAAHITDGDHSRVILVDAAEGENGDDVSVRDLAEAGMAPNIAILASCGSAAASDEAGIGSVAAAFAKSGTRMIVATDRTVKDEQVRAFMEAFLGQPDWRTNTAVALGRTQQAAKDGPLNGVAVGTQVWGSFMVITRAPYVPAPSTAALQKP